MIKKTSLKTLFFFFLIAFAGCTTSPKSRNLSKDEMERYHLSGILNEAKICPTKFDDKLKISKIIGDCEIVSCEMIGKETICKARPEKIDGQHKY